MNSIDWGVIYTTPGRLVQDYPNILQDMADLKYAVLSVSGFYKSEYCREIVTRIERDQTGMVTVKEYQNAAGGKLSLRYIGPGLGQYVDDDPFVARQGR